MDTDLISIHTSIEDGNPIEFNTKNTMPQDAYVFAMEILLTELFSHYSFNSDTLGSRKETGGTRCTVLKVQDVLELYKREQLSD